MNYLRRGHGLILNKIEFLGKTRTHLFIRQTLFKFRNVDFTTFPLCNCSPV